MTIEPFLLRFNGGPWPGTFHAREGSTWPLPEMITPPEGGGVYKKISESQLPPQSFGSHLIRGAEYKWEPDQPIRLNKMNREDG